MDDIKLAMLGNGEAVQMVMRRLEAFYESIHND